METHGIIRLSKSSRAWVALVAIVGAIVMNVLGRIDGERALEFIKYIVIALIGSTAAEDIAKKYGAGAGTDAEETPNDQSK